MTQLLEAAVATQVPCLVCASQTVTPFLSLGEAALANKFVTAEEAAVPEPLYPLTVGFCRTCAHVQLLERVPPRVMFEDYLYTSAASDTLRTHFAGLSADLVRRCRLRPGDLVIDIGCNDGTLLQAFRNHGVRTLGVDPAANLARLHQGDGIDRYVDLFGTVTAEEIARRWGPAALVVATNTFPHIPDLPDFLGGLRAVLAPGGTFVVEAHYLLDLLDQRAFDTVYHEHVSYWALGPMCRLFRTHGFDVVHAERLPLHHGQLRVFVRRTGETAASPAVAEVLALERARGLDRLSTYEQFAEDVRALKRELTRTFRDLRGAGKRLVGYGAPAKGSTLLAFLEVTSETVAYIVDRSPLKQGRYTPGTHIPIVAPERLLADQPDYVLLFAWNFADEVLAQQHEYRRRGGRFILPLPEVRILS